MSHTHYFVTATGTDVGKTAVTSGLLRIARERSRAVTAVKPVATGFDKENMASSDAARLAEAMGLAASLPLLDRLCPWKFALPLSPHLAAAAEGRAIVFDDVVAFCHETMASAKASVLIEGIGGAMVPVNRERTVLDLIEAISLPVVLVCGSYLGSISHTLTTVAALRHRGIRIAATLISESVETAGTLDDMVDTIRTFTANDVFSVRRTVGGAPAPAAFAPLYEKLWT